MCPKCHRIVQLINGSKRPYFRHIGEKSNLQAESAVHLAGKKWLANFFRPFFKVDLEYVWDAEQRLDLFVRNSHWRLAVEYQCSPISKAELARRNQLYIKKTLRPLWIFGPQHYRRIHNLRHLQNIVSYSSQWGFYVLFKLPQDNFLRLNCHYQIEPHTTILHWQQRKIKHWQQLLQLRIPKPFYSLQPINWQKWYQQQQQHPNHQFIILQNWCYSHRLSLIEFIKKTPSQTMFPIYIYRPCYLPLLWQFHYSVTTFLPLVTTAAIQACAAADYAKFDNLV